MDPVKLRTLALFESAAMYLPVQERGKQLVYVVKDFAEEGEHEEARRVLRLIEVSYFEDHLYRQIAEDGLFARAVAILVEAFGNEFWLLAKEPAGTA